MKICVLYFKRCFFFRKLLIFKLHTNTPLKCTKDISLVREKPNNTYCRLSAGLRTNRYSTIKWTTTPANNRIVVKIYFSRCDPFLCPVCLVLFSLRVVVEGGVERANYMFAHQNDGEWLRVVYMRHCYVYSALQKHNRSIGKTTEFIWYTKMIVHCEWWSWSKTNTMLYVID